MSTTFPRFVKKNSQKSLASESGRKGIEVENLDLDLSILGDLSIPKRFAHLPKKDALEFLLADKAMLLDLARKSFADALKFANKAEREYLLSNFKESDPAKIHLAIKTLDSLQAQFK